MSARHCSVIFSRETKLSDLQLNSKREGEKLLKIVQN
jgi:hypothetical protein